MNPKLHLTRFFSELKYSFKLALPLIIGEVIYGLNSFIATIMVANLGRNELAANALVWQIYLTIVVFSMGAISAVSVMVSQSYGARDQLGVSICFKQRLIMSVVLSVPMILLVYFSPVILMWTNQDPLIISFAKPFFHSLLWTILPTNLLVLIYNLLIGLAKTRIAMITSLLIVPIEILFYYLFLYGKFGLPKFGLSGVGYALSLSHGLCVILLLYYLQFFPEFKSYKLFVSWWRINKKFLFELIRVGLPIGTMFFIEISLFAVVAIMMGKFGTVALAAYQIANQYLMIAIVVIFALAQNVGIRVGYEVGRNNRPALKLAVLVNMVMGLALLLLPSAFYTFFPETAIKIDLDTNSANLKSLVDTAKSYLSVIAILMLVEGIRIISSGALRGLKDTRFLMFVSAIGFWVVAFPTTYLLAFKLHMGGTGILWGIVIGLLVTGCTLFIRFNYLAKRIDLVSLVTKS